MANPELVQILDPHGPPRGLCGWDQLSSPIPTFFDLLLIPTLSEEIYETHDQL